jgi:hypothetical protein
MTNIALNAASDPAVVVGEIGAGVNIVPAADAKPARFTK